MKKIIRVIKKLYSFFLFYLFGGTASARFLGVKVGEGCRIYINDFGTEPFLINIGNNVTLTKGVNLLTHDGATCLVEDGKGRYYKYGSIEIGSNVFVGVNSVLMPGVKIGSNVIIGTGSVVTKDIPDNSVYAGSPAMFIMSYSEYCYKIRNSCVNGSEVIQGSTSYQERVLRIIEIQNEKK
ncbi:acyltransferase [Pseudoalteromonas simplex]|uniref:acyltransferase n=1 Tax=Pseudoalteromonas simplex TaxID=2783613 RepID=UPI0018872F61|nr:acyltransferase [Pseudoalteromonas sp. A520]